VKRHRASHPKVATGTRPNRRLRLPSPTLIIALIALILSTTGLADAARRAITASIDGHQLTTKPKAGAVLLLGKNHKFPAAAIPTVANAKRVGGKTVAELAGTCPPHAVDIGTWCLDSAPYALTSAQQGENNYLWASKACEAEGGWLPSAAELIGAAARVQLESTVKDNPSSATVSLEPALGLTDKREMSSTLVTTEAGSSAAGSEGVSEGATGNPRQGQPNPVPQPANPTPQALQYVTVYDNGNQGGFAGSEPVSHPENFRCAFNKSPQQATEGEG
jgi:hypothetical protein